tara:strand:+ start:1271 stop:1510 length:240 start_codon:yes stop_codon:yes gene_type:complete
VNREIKTDLDNILSHISCAIDYGYYDDVLMTDFATMTGFVTDDEINWYVESNKSVEYSQEDYDQWRERIIEWRNKFTRK